MNRITVLPGVWLLVVSLATVVYGQCNETEAATCVSTLKALPDPCTASNLATTRTCLIDTLGGCGGDVRDPAREFRRLNKTCEDPCQFNTFVEPCRNGGTCSPVANSPNFTCACVSGFTGNRCENVISVTKLVDCATDNGGCLTQTCVDTRTGVICQCDAGFQWDETTSTCVDIDECNSGVINCQFGCMNTNGSFTCTCAANYTLNTDNTCTRDADITCVNCTGVNTVCQFSNDQETCLCNYGFELNTDTATCQNINECLVNSRCGSRAQCTDVTGDDDAGFKCSCPPGYQLRPDQLSCQECSNETFGDKCDEACSSCDVTNTLTCDPVTGCICTTGFDGSTCSNDINECDGISCGTTGTCVSEAAGTFECTCDAGYENQDLVSSSTCIDLDECSEPYLNDCGPGTSCVNEDGTFSCQCPTGYTLETNGTCVDTDECDTENICSTNGNCTNTVGSYICTCNDGFTLNDDSSTCIDIDECESARCAELEMCVNSPGTFSCECQSGYRREENNCVDINECDGDPCGGGTCDNTNGSFTCQCNPGYETQDLSDGLLTCVEIDECASNPTPCGHLCENTPLGSFTCFCDSGFALEDSTKCQDIDECRTEDCGDRQSCSNKPGDYVCLCAQRTRKLDKYVMYIKLTIKGTSRLAAQLIIAVRQAMKDFDPFWNVTVCDTSERYIIIALESKSKQEPSEMTEMALFANDNLLGLEVEDNGETAEITAIELLDDVDGEPSAITGPCSVFETLTVCQNDGTCEVNENEPECNCPARTEGEFCETRTGLSTTLIIVSGVSGGVFLLFIILSIILVIFYCRLLRQRRKSGFKPSHHTQSYNQPRFEDPRAHSVPDKDDYDGSLGYRTRGEGNWWHNQGYHTQRSRAAAFNPRSFQTVSQAGWGPTNNNWHDEHDTYGRDRYRSNRGGDGHHYDYGDDPGYFNSSPRQYRSPYSPSTNA